VQGTFSALDFNILLVKTAPVGGTATVRYDGEAFAMGVSVGEDFGDLPASYEGSQAASHIVGDLKLGSTIDADNTTTLDPTTSPYSVAAGGDGNGTNGDGADEDALSTVPPLLAGTASTYGLDCPSAERPRGLRRGGGLPGRDPRRQGLRRCAGELRHGTAHGGRL